MFTVAISPVALAMRKINETGQDRTGQDMTGKDRTGQIRTGHDRIGQHRTGQDNRQSYELADYASSILL